MKLRTDFFETIIKQTKQIKLQLDQEGKKKGLNIRNERGDITILHTTQRIVTDHYEYL